MKSTSQTHTSPTKETDLASALDLLDFYRLDDPYQSIQSGQQMSRAWVKNLNTEQRLPMARSFVYQVASSYWKQLHGKTNLPLPKNFGDFFAQDLEHSVMALAIALGESLSRISIDDSAQALGKLYTSLLPDTLRSENGIFYTPSSLVKRLMYLASASGTDWSSTKVLDPACGAGAFLIPICLKMIESKKGEDPNTILNHLCTNIAGMDQDPFAGWLCQLLLESAMMEIIIAAGRRPKTMVKICDSLSAAPLKGKKAFDLVIANPPYGKVKLSPALRERYSESLFGHANLYGVFTQLCFDLVKQDGIIALLTPTSFLSGEYFKNLRAYIRINGTPLEFDFVSFRKDVFEEVLQETMLSVYKKGKVLDTLIPVNEITTGSAGTLKIESLGNFYLTEDFQQPWILPRMPGQSAAVGRMFAMKGRLADWGYRVSTGQLVWNRHKEQLLHKNTAESKPIIWAESVTPDGRFLWKATRKNHAPAIRLKASQQYLLTTASCVVLQRTTAKEQHKRLIAALIPQEFIDARGGVVIENHLNMIVTVTSDATQQPIVPLAVISAFLNTRAVNDAFRAISGSVAVSAYELESFPLPLPEDLLDLSAAISGGEMSSIEEICKKLYQ